MADEKNNEGLGMVKSAASAAGGNILSQAMAMATRGWENKQQLKQQKKLQDLGIAGSKELGKYNQELALDTWHKTNYGAQAKELRKAGLNVGLMYEGGGAGGTTSGGSGGNVSGGQATGASALPHGMGMQLGMQMRMQEAQIENIKADTATKQANLPKPQVEIENIKQITENEKVKNRILKFEADIQEVAARVARDTEANQIQAISEAANKATAEAKQAETSAEIWERTRETAIRKIDQDADEQLIRMAAMRAGILKTNADTAAVRKQIEKATAEITKIRQEIPLMHEDRAQRDRELAMKHQEIETRLKEEGLDAGWITMILQLLK